MITLLVGHRGVGKTSLLKRIAKYRELAKLGPCQFYDLDEEIVKSARRSIEEIFSADGESEFRKIEEETLNSLIQRLSTTSYVALGAGYQGRFPESKKLEVIWVRRITDSAGRIFFNRPRLNQEVSPKEEYLARFAEREERYQRQCTQQLVIREGDFDFDPGEFQYFTNQFSTRSGFLTFDNKLGPHAFKLPFERIELRDDLLDEERIKSLISSQDPSLILYSHRLHKSSISHANNKKYLVDWPLELGTTPLVDADIISSHEDPTNGPDLCAFLAQLEECGRDKILKAAPVVSSFADILIGFEWQQRDSLKRAFLPRSKSGRWKWFRQWMKGKMPVNFFRIHEGSAPDQPTLLEWLDTPNKASSFAAIVGAPVAHSYTPTEQREFFSQYGMPVLNIDIDHDEFKDALAALIKMGLKAAAVTSPLKKRAFEACHHLSDAALSVKSVNTLFIGDNGQVWGHNTDLDGFSQLVQEAQIQDPVGLWGGGGTLPIMKKVLPNATSYSARTGLPRENESVLNSPRTLIWATGEIFPPSNWQPQLVVDLNYSDHSSGREYALLKGCQYVSGLAMFKSQAQFQREYWKDLLIKETP